MGVKKGRIFYGWDIVAAGFLVMFCSIGIVIADSLLGEITPAMAAAVCQSSAARVLIPINHCDNIVVGVPDQPIGQLVAAAVEKVKELIR